MLVVKKLSSPEIDKWEKANKPKKQVVDGPLFTYCGRVKTGDQ